MNRQATVIVLLALVIAILLFGSGKLPRAWAALWGPASAADATMSADAQNIVKASLGIGAASLVVLALSDTALYPLAIGVLVSAALYLMVYGGGVTAVHYFDLLLTNKPTTPATPAKKGT